MTGQYLFLTGMLLSFGVILVLCFLAFDIVLLRRLWDKMAEFTTLCVDFKQLIADAEETKKKTAKVYSDALAEREYKEIDGKIALVPKNVEEVG